MARRHRKAKLECQKRLMDILNHKKKEQKASKEIPSTRVKLKRQRIYSTGSEESLEKKDRSESKMHLANENLPSAITKSDKAAPVKVNVDVSVDNNKNCKTDKATVKIRDNSDFSKEVKGRNNVSIVEKKEEPHCSQKNLCVSNELKVSVSKVKDSTDFSKKVKNRRTTEENDKSDYSYSQKPHVNSSKVLPDVHVDQSLSKNLLKIKESASSKKTSNETNQTSDKRTESSNRPIKICKTSTKVNDKDGYKKITLHRSTHTHVREKDNRKDKQKTHLTTSHESAPKLDQPDCSKNIDSQNNKQKTHLTTSHESAASLKFRDQPDCSRNINSQNNKQKTHLTTSHESAPKFDQPDCSKNIDSRNNKQKTHLTTSHESAASLKFRDQPDCSRNINSQNNKQKTHLTTSHESAPKFDQPDCSKNIDSRNNKQKTHLTTSHESAASLKFRDQPDCSRNINSQNNKQKTHLTTSHESAPKFDQPDCSKNIDSRNNKQKTHLTTSHESAASLKFRDQPDCSRNINSQNNKQKTHLTTSHESASSSLKFRDQPDCTINIDNHIKDASVKKGKEIPVSNECNSVLTTAMAPTNKTQPVYISEEDKKLADLQDRFRKRKLQIKLSSPNKSEEPLSKRLSLSRDRASTSSQDRASTSSQDRASTSSQDRASTSSQETGVDGIFKIPFTSPTIKRNDNYNHSSREEDLDDNISLFADTDLFSCLDDSGTGTSQKETLFNPFRQKLNNEPTKTPITEKASNSFLQRNKATTTKNSENASLVPDSRHSVFTIPRVPDRTVVKTVPENKNKQFINQCQVEVSSIEDRATATDASSSLKCTVINDNVTDLEDGSKMKQKVVKQSNKAVDPSGFVENSPITGIMTVSNCENVSVTMLPRVLLERLKPSVFQNNSKQKLSENNKQRQPRVQGVQKNIQNTRKAQDTNQIEKSVAASCSSSNSTNTTHKQLPVVGKSNILHSKSGEAASTVTKIKAPSNVLVNKTAAPVDASNAVTNVLVKKTAAPVGASNAVTNVPVRKTSSPAGASNAVTNVPVKKTAAPVGASNAVKNVPVKKTAAPVGASNAVTNVPVKKTAAPVGASNAVTGNKMSNRVQQPQSGKSQSTAFTRSNSLESLLQGQHNMNENPILVNPQANLKSVSQESSRPSNLIRSSSMESIFNECADPARPRTGPKPPSNIVSKPGPSGKFTTKNLVVPNQQNRFSTVVGSNYEQALPATSSDNVLRNPVSGERDIRSSEGYVVNSTDKQNCLSGTTTTNRPPHRNRNFSIKNCDDSSVIVQKYINSQRNICDSQRSTISNSEVPAVATLVRPNEKRPPINLKRQTSRINARIVSERNTDSNSAPDSESEDEDEDDDDNTNQVSGDFSIRGDIQSPCQFLITGQCSNSECSSVHAVEGISVKNKTKYEASLTNYINNGYDYAYKTSVRLLARELVMLPVSPDKSEWENFVTFLHTCSKMSFPVVLEYIVNCISDLTLRPSTLNILFEVIVNHNAIINTWTKDFQKLINKCEVLHCTPEIITAYMRYCVIVEPPSSSFCTSIFDFLLCKAKIGTVLRIPRDVFKKYAHMLKRYDPNRRKQLAILLNVQESQNSLLKNSNGTSESSGGSISVDTDNHATVDNIQHSVNNLNEEHHQRHASGGSEQGSSASFHSLQESRPGFSEFRQPASRLRRANLTDSSSVNVPMHDLRNTLNLQRNIDSNDRNYLTEHRIPQTRYQKPLSADNLTSNTCRNRQFNASDEPRNATSNYHNRRFSASDEPRNAHSDLPIESHTGRFARSYSLYNNSSAGHTNNLSSHTVTNPHSVQENQFRHNQSTQRFYRNQPSNPRYHRGGNVPRFSYRRPLLANPPTLPTSATNSFANAVTSQHRPLNSHIPVSGCMDESIIYLKRSLVDCNMVEAVELLVLDMWTNNWKKYSEAIFAVLSGNLDRASSDFRRLLEEAAPHLQHSPGHLVHIFKRVGEELVEELRGKKKFQFALEVERLYQSL